jgi:hypothetical protein
MLLLPCSYVKVRQLPQFAGCSIITMTSNTQHEQQQQQQQQDPSNPTAAAANGSSSSSSRELAVSAELDTLMLAEVLAVASEGGAYPKALGQPGAATAAAGSGSSSSSAALSREAAAALPWLKGLLWTMSMYYAGVCLLYFYCMFPVCLLQVYFLYSVCILYMPRGQGLAAIGAESPVTTTVC